MQDSIEDNIKRGSLLDLIRRMVPSVKSRRPADQVEVLKFRAKLKRERKAFNRQRCHDLGQLGNYYDHIVPNNPNYQMCKRICRYWIFSTGYYRLSAGHRG